MATDSGDAGAVRDLAGAASWGLLRSVQNEEPGRFLLADIDDEFISIHHYLKWHKFGFTRSYDNLSLEIRAGRMTRDEAIEILRERGDETPHDDIRAFCDYVGISTNEFFELIERFRDRDIWTRRDGVWIIEDFLIPDFPWGRVPAGA